MASATSEIAYRADLSGLPVVIGGGLAGMMTALSLSPRPCVLLTQAALGGVASSAWAQGGIAAALGPDDDEELHLRDTLAAGAGLCDPGAARRIVAAAGDAIAALERHGVRFDRDAAGRLRLGLEAAHSRRRIVHAAGDGTGAAIVTALAQAVRATASISVVEHTKLRHLLHEDGAVLGLVAAGPSGDFAIASRQVVLATGGLGGLFEETTNPLQAIGQGAALAARAGAVLSDMEFVQFHPTALAAGVAQGPRALISEAVRGEGAHLVDETGARFTDEMAPRDVVSRAVWRHIASGHAVFLDARQAVGAAFGSRFPGIAALCGAAGIDPATMPIPVRPAAHYHMGGIAVDARGRSTAAGLWACGEVASTGLHGANRLASNSLLEAAVCAAEVAADIHGAVPPPAAPVRVRAAPVPSAGAQPAIRRVMTAGCGVLRDKAGLAAAIGELAALPDTDDAALVALFVAAMAYDRRESRGAQYRTDRPDAMPQAARGFWDLPRLRRAVDEVVGEGRA